MPMSDSHWTLQQLTVAFALVVFSTMGLAIDVQGLSDEEIHALTEKQIDDLPWLDLIERGISDRLKNPDTRKLLVSTLEFA